MKLQAVILALLILPTIGHSHASSQGAMNEILSNEEMQLYAISLSQSEVMGGRKQISVELVLKNIGQEPRAFNIFFGRLIDSSGEEHRASPLLSTIMPIRITPNDIVRGFLIFNLQAGAQPSTLIWQEPGNTSIVNLTRAKQPADPLPTSEWQLASNKGIALSDGRSQVTVNDELLDRSGTPYYAVDLSIKNLGDETIPYSAAYAFIKDQDGYLYLPDLQNLDLLGNPLRKGELAKGQEVRGQVLFFVRESTSGVMLIYDEGIGRGSYFAVPEFPQQVLILMTSAGIALLVARLAYHGDHPRRRCEEPSS